MQLHCPWDAHQAEGGRGVPRLSWVRTPRIDDAETLAAKLARFVSLELAAVRVDATLALQGAITRCDCLTIVDAENYGEPIGLVGVAEHPDDPQTGVVFAFMTDRLLQEREAFYAVSRGWLDAIDDKFFVLMGASWSRNLPCALWLRALGFESLVTSECKGEFFRSFVRTRTPRTPPNAQKDN